MIKQGMKQVGFLVMGAGLNARAWIDLAKAAGQAVRIREGFVEFWK